MSIIRELFFTSPIEISCNVIVTLGKLIQQKCSIYKIFCRDGFTGAWMAEFN